MSGSNKGCLTAIFPFLKLFFKENKEEQKLPYAKRDDFLSFSELSFYKVMSQVVDERIIICPKVGLKDIFFVSSKDKSDFRTYHNKIDRKHIDFLLCNAENMKPICGVELDDSSHQRANRVDRDRFVNEVFKVAGVPLLRFENKKCYTLNEVKEKLNAVIYMNEESEENKETLEIQEEVNNPICPKCKIPMVKREVKKGQNKGKEFWGCSNYPKCRETHEL